MKKSVVFLLLAIAVVVLVSPRIVGRLAEQSMDQNLDWAATETQEISVTSLGFDRGWFSYPHMLKTRFLDPARGNPDFDAVLEKARLRHEAFRAEFF